MRDDDSDEDLIPDEPLSVPHYDGEVYQTSTGRWAWVIRTNGVDTVHMDGYEAEDMARSEMCDMLLPYTRQAFVAQMFAEGGYVGDDAQGRLIRTLPGGRIEVLEKGGDSASS